MLVFSMILAMDESNLVGNSEAKYGIPWHYSEDMVFYKNMTMGKKNIMGRKTFELIGRPLPNRETYIVTRDESYHVDGCVTINNIGEILKLNSNEEIMIIGGAEIFNLMFDYIDRIYLTKVLNTYKGDCYYDLNLSNFRLLSSKQGENKELVFEVYERNN